MREVLVMRTPSIVLHAVERETYLVLDRPWGQAMVFLTIARGTLPLAMFGPENYAYRPG